LTFNTGVRIMPERAGCRAIRLLGKRRELRSGGSARVGDILRAGGHNVTPQTEYLPMICGGFLTGEREEVAKAALFLASDDSSFIMRIELFVDGGRARV
jgi:NAD(P)-dependent dehydrogenase (short-subunit alcohol dehydrogenase family)